MHHILGGRVWLSPLADDIYTPQVGDVVRLVSGGPEMTVLDACYCGDVDVAWFDGNKMNETTLPDEALELV